MSANPAARFGLGVAAVGLIAVAWSVLLVVWHPIEAVSIPYRLIRRGSRKGKREALQHREVLAAIGQISNPK